MEILYKIVDYLNLGNLLENPIQVSGGLTHRMFKLVTSNGNYIVKLLNPNIMKRSTAMDNFNRADFLEEILKENNIDAIYSIKFNDKKMQCIDNQYFYVYEWFDGKSLKDNEITKYNCSKIGETLAKIHNIDLKEGKIKKEKMNIDWNNYLELSKGTIIYDMLKDKIDLLYKSMNNGNKTIGKLPNVLAVCHNDMDSKNVMWLNDEFRLIDLECLNYNNPYSELFELALCWSGYETCNIDFDLFTTFFNSYFDNTILNKNIDWETMYYSNYGRLEWLEFNIKRSLMIDCDTKEKQEIGINEVKETLEHVVYYDKIKEEILKSINNLII
jgi:Ser/Thr protein kinase RdoA (MazF antagonist)